MVEITRKEISALFGKRHKGASKDDFGRVLVVAGSEGMAGAAILAARAALRAGAGIAAVSIEKPLFPIVQVAIPEAICLGRDLSAELSKERLSRFDAAVIGPGLGTTDSAAALLSHLLENFEGNIVLDADALNILAASRGTDLKRAFAAAASRIIITPHAGEAARLLGGEWTREKIQQDREAALAALEKKFACTVVLKGAGTLVTPNRINTTGNPGMATGGSGDVLSGIIGSLLAQGFAPETAAAAGVYIHGLAGDIAAEERGEAGLLAGDIADAVATALKVL